MRGQQYIYIYTSYNICTNKRPHSAKLSYSNIITLRVRVRINRGSSLLPLIAHKRKVTPHCKTSLRILSRGSSKRTSEIAHRKDSVYGN